jgi:hypothetical protein
MGDDLLDADLEELKREKERPKEDQGEKGDDPVPIREKRERTSARKKGHAASVLVLEPVLF